MKKALAAAVAYLATNPKARAAEYALLLGVVEAVRAAVGHP